MPLSPSEFYEACKAICPICRRDGPVTQRNSTGEWVHNQTEKSGAGNVVSISLCWADGLRRSRFAPKGKKNG